MDQKSLRDAIQSVRNDSTLTPNQITARIQQLMSSQQQAESSPRSPQNLGSNLSCECPHYQKKCSNFFFECCQLVDPCHRCHLERGCQSKPPKIKTIKCNVCSIVQDPSPVCSNCSTPFSTSYCNTCKIWTQLQITHCDDCGFCRVGEPGSLFHCETCDACFPLSGKRSHSCTKINTRDQNCFSCLEPLFTSQKNFHIMQCGHLVHSHCLDRFLRTGNYRCPLCRKAITSMSEHWRTLRLSIQLQPMPPVDIFHVRSGDLLLSPYGKFLVQESHVVIFQDIFETPLNGMLKGELLDWTLANGKHPIASLNRDALSQSKILKSVHCQDCEKQCITPFHFIGMECLHCGSFNTVQN